ncbi:endonuclease domain-containing protein [Acidovorax sp. HDW3]|nr:endonuclease domain-containing protein [Acidovorax sp. HDW3]
MHQRDFAKTLRQTMTDAEQRLWKHLRAHRLDGQKFRRQHPIGPYVVDFVHFGARLIVEADGGQHGESLHDQARDAWLRSQGFAVLRFWNNDILLHTDGVLESIWAALRAADPSPPAPLPQGERGATAALTHPPLPQGERGATAALIHPPLSQVTTPTSPHPLPSPLAGEGPGERGQQP